MAGCIAASRAVESSIAAGSKRARRRVSPPLLPMGTFASDENEDQPLLSDNLGCRQVSVNLADPPIFASLAWPKIIQRFCDLDSDKR